MIWIMLPRHKVLILILMDQCNQPWAESILRLNMSHDDLCIVLKKNCIQDIVSRNNPWGVWILIQFKTLFMFQTPLYIQYKTHRFHLNDKY